MPRRRFLISPDRIRDGIAVLTPDQSHHLRDVLRLRAGDEVELFDGEGTGFSGKIECRGAEIRVGPLRKLETAGTRAISVTLAAALIKPDRFDWMLQKGTELGVDRFLPIETRFSNIHLAGARLEARLGRWQRIVREASKQCGRLTVPDVQAPARLEAILAAPEFERHSRFMLHAQAPQRLAPDLSSCGPVLLCVGPEGGWEASEIEAAERAGLRIVSLGSQVLRAETACLAAVAILRFLLDR